MTKNKTQYYTTEEIASFMVTDITSKFPDFSLIKKKDYPNKPK